MAVFDHQEQEQLSELRAVWEQHGRWVTTLLMALAVASVGWFGWKEYRNRMAGGAASLYASLESSVQASSSAGAREVAGQLIDQYPKSAYAQLAALKAAHAQLNGGDVKSAKAQLTWLMDNGVDDALRTMARLRLAALEMDEGAYDRAQAVLAPDVPAAFAFRRSDLLGDVLMAQGKKAEARTAWLAALDAFAATGASASPALRDLVQLKLDSIPGDK